MASACVPSCPWSALVSWRNDNVKELGHRGRILATPCLSTRYWSLWGAAFWRNSTASISHVELSPALLIDICMGSVKWSDLGLGVCFYLYHWWIKLRKSKKQINNTPSQGSSQIKKRERESKTNKVDVWEEGREGWREAPCCPAEVLACLVPYQYQEGCRNALWRMLLLRRRGLKNWEW